MGMVYAVYGLGSFSEEEIGSLLLGTSDDTGLVLLTAFLAVFAFFAVTAVVVLAVVLKKTKKMLWREDMALKAIANAHAAKAASEKDRKSLEKAKKLKGKRK